MLRGERPTLDGKHYQVVGRDQLAARVASDPGDDRRRRRAQDAADGGPVRRRVEHHRRAGRHSRASSTRSPSHCEALGRDRGEITVSQQLSACIAPTHEEAEAELIAGLDRSGVNLEGPSATPRSTATCGATPTPSAEQLAADLDAGVDGWTINLPANGHIPDRVELLGQTAAKVLADH